MRVSIKLSIAIIIFFSLGFISEDQWTLIEKKENLELYSGPKSESGIYPFKAKFVVKHSIEHIIMILLDTKHKPDWVPRVTKSFIVENKALNNRVEYAEVNMPWPVTNRDVIIRVITTVSKDLEEVIIKIQSDFDEKIYDKNNIRVKVFPSILRMIHNSKTGLTNLETESFMDPGGSIPIWIVNFFQKVESKRLARKMVEQLDKNIYTEEQLLKVRKGLIEISKITKDRPISGANHLK